MARACWPPTRTDTMTKSASAMAASAPSDHDDSEAGIGTFQNLEQMAPHHLLALLVHVVQRDLLDRHMAPVPGQRVYDARCPGSPSSNECDFHLAACTAPPVSVPDRLLSRRYARPVFIE